MNKIVLEVDESTAKLYNEAPDFKKRSINYLLYEWLKKDVSKKSISDIMDKIGFEAMSNGLSQEDFERIMNEQ